MIKSAIKNYFKHFKYVFSGMGVIYLALLIVIFAAFSMGANILSDAAHSSFSELEVFLNSTFHGITLQEVFQNNFIRDFLDGILSIFSANGENVVAKFAALAAGLLSFLLFALKLSAYLMRRLIRTDVSDKETKRGLFVMIVRYLMTLISAVIAAVLLYYWAYSLIFFVLLFGVIKALEQLYVTWFVYFKKSLPRKNFFRAKHVLNLLAANFASIALNLVVIVLLALIVNLFFALLVAVPLIVYSFTVIEFTTVDYFQRVKLKLAEKSSDETPRKNTAEISLSECAPIISAEISDGSVDKIPDGIPTTESAIESAKTPKVNHSLPRGKKKNAEFRPRQKSKSE